MTKKDLIVLLVGITLTVLSTVFGVLYFTHECPEAVMPEMTKENIEKIKEITHATSDDVDSLLMVEFGFEPM